MLSQPIANKKKEKKRKQNLTVAHEIEKKIPKNVLMTCQENKSQFKIRQHIFLACGLRYKIMVFFKSFLKRTEELKDTLKDFHEFKVCKEQMK